jgi:hypothetical protein
MKQSIQTCPSGLVERRDGEAGRVDVHRVLVLRAWARGLARLELAQVLCVVAWRPSAELFGYTRNPTFASTSVVTFHVMRDTNACGAALLSVIFRLRLLFFTATGAPSRPAQSAYIPARR